MTQLLQSVDARTKLAGRNQLEILLFTLGRNDGSGRQETFGINVFKVREVMHVPEITRAPDAPAAVEGMVSLRGQVVPVIHLARYCNFPVMDDPGILVITEYNRHVQGFLVHSVESIVRLDWEEVRVPPSMIMAERAGLVTAVTELDDGRLVMIMDVEKVLADVAGFYQDESIFQSIDPIPVNVGAVLFADDSIVARQQVRKTLERLGIKPIEATNGTEAWTQLCDLADRAAASEQPLKHLLSAVVTDIEMPEMDGYVLTQRIKDDQRFKGIPVIMHSSLSGNANLGASVGADVYVPKFDPTELANSLKALLPIP
tara:strand:- start:1052 stop:1996 length:945 start_codon:yes stop_codon:yes gene_type:complete